MAKYKIVHEQSKCIGCSACAAVAPELFEMDDGKSLLKKGKKAKNNVYECIIEQKDLSDAKQAEQSCPVECIHVEESK